MYNIGDRFFNNNHEEYVIIGLNKYPTLDPNTPYITYMIEFVNTKSVIECMTENIDTGIVLDPYSKCYFGVGYIGNPEKYGYNCYDDINKKIKDLWISLLRRCYDEKYTSYIEYGYQEYTVCDRWMLFENFYYDFINMNNFDNWKNETGKYKLVFIDPACKIYSPEATTITHINNIRCINAKSNIYKGGYIGVYKRRRANVTNYQAKLNYCGEEVVNATFDEAIYAAVYRDWYAKYYNGSNACCNDGVVSDDKALFEAMKHRMFPKHGPNAGKEYHQLYHLIDNN